MKGRQLLQLLFPLVQDIFIIIGYTMIHIVSFWCSSSREDFL